MATITSPFPTIDISPFLSPTPNPETLTKTAAALSAACAHPGFFYLTNHNLPLTLTTSVLAHARQFFLTAPSAEKDLLKRKDAGVENGDGARGYQTIGDNITEGKKDWHEAIDWYRPVRAGEPHAASHRDTDGTANGHRPDRQPPYSLLQGLNAWPTTPPSFRPTYEEYIALMLTLGTAVVRALGMALGDGMDDVFVQNTRESWWVMRAIGYPPPPRCQNFAANGDEEEEGANGGVSCGAHSDYGCVTLLLADETEGALQAWVGDEGGRWVDADPVRGALVVNIGDMMSRWSGGRWKATRHRVVHKGDGFRVSVPFFFEPDWNARVPGRAGEGDVVYGEYLEGKVRGNF